MKKSIPISKWKWFGNAGHFCCADNCKFHLYTKVGKYLISTVGEYFSSITGEKTTLSGWDKFFYETMVFKAGKACHCGCGMSIAKDWTELDRIYYEKPKEANEGHLGMCKKWSKK